MTLPAKDDKIVHVHNPDGSNYWQQITKESTPSGKDDKVSIIIPVHNLDGSAIKRLDACLKSLGNVSIALSDTSVTETNWYDIAGLPYFWEPNTGPFNRSRAINNGFRHLVKGQEYVIVCDADLILPSGCIDTMESYLARYPYVLGKTRYTDTYSYFSGFFGIKTDFFRQVNGFDEEYIGWGAEDDDFSFRCSLTGNILQAKDLIARHQYHPLRSYKSEAMPNRARYYERREMYAAREIPVWKIKGLKNRKDE